MLPSTPPKSEGRYQQDERQHEPREIWSRDDRQHAEISGHIFAQDVRQAKNWNFKWNCTT